MCGHSGQLSVNYCTNVWIPNLIGSFKIKYMISCIPTRIPLVYDGILQYWFGFGFYTPQTWRGSWECKNSNKMTCSWTLKSPEATAVATLLVGEITDCIHSQDNSSMCSQQDCSKCSVCQDSLPVWPAAVECNYYIPLRHGKLGRGSRHIFLSLLLLPPEIKKKTAGSWD